MLSEWGRGSPHCDSLCCVQAAGQALAANCPALSWCPGDSLTRQGPCHLPLADGAQTPASHSP